MRIFGRETFSEKFHGDIGVFPGGRAGGAVTTTRTSFRTEFAARISAPNISESEKSRGQLDLQRVYRGVRARRKETGWLTTGGKLAVIEQSAERLACVDLATSRDRRPDNTSSAAP